MSTGVRDDSKLINSNFFVFIDLVLSYSIFNMPNHFFMIRTPNKTFNYIVVLLSRPLFSFPFLCSFPLSK